MSSNYHGFLTRILQSPQSLYPMWLEDDEVSDWPESTVSQEWCLHLSSHSWLQEHEEEQVEEHVEALKAALERPDIETLIIADRGLLTNKETKSLLVELMAQERIQRVYCWVHHKKEQSCYDFLFSQLQTVRYLGLHTITEEMFPLLRSLPKLQYLDLSGAIVGPHLLYLLYQDEALARVTPHVALEYHEEDDFAQPVQFPPLANTYLRSFTFQLEDATLVVFPLWVQQASRLQNLQFFQLSLDTEFGDSDEQPVLDCDTDCIAALFDWIRSPSCQLTHLNMSSKFIFTVSLPLEKSLMLLEAIGTNRSIEELCIHSLSDDLDWCTDILPNLLKSNVHHLDLHSIEKWNNCDELLEELLLEMRPTRLISISKFNYSDDGKVHIPFDYVSGVHARWKKWLEFSGDRYSTTIPTSSVVFALPRYLWAQELERMDQSKRKFLRTWSLDATYFLLQHWFSTISEIPPPTQVHSG